MTEKPISISAAARAIGVNKSTLARQLKGSGVEFVEGKARLSDVLAYRASAIDLTRSGRRAGKGDSIDVDATMPLADATPAEVDATVESEDGEPVLVDGQTLSYRDARALKETYLARLRKHEYEIAMGEWVRVENVGRIVEQEYGVVRQATLNSTSKTADRCVGKDRMGIKLVLDEAAEEILSHLSNPDDMTTKAASRSN